MAGYTASKSAVLGLTRSLARDLGPFNIRGLLGPARLGDDAAPDRSLADRRKPRRRSCQQCLKRKLYPEDIARPVLFFASDEAGACTNQSYVVDGGWV